MSLDDRRVDIREPLIEICGRLGVDPSDVRVLMIRHREADAVLYTRNAMGDKFVAADGEPAVTARVWAVRT